MEARNLPQQGASRVSVRIAAQAKLPSRFGDFTVVAFDSSDGREHAAVVQGEVSGASSVPIRLHSECFTGDVMGSLRCDCRDQLELSLKSIASHDVGMVIYLRQEGRGIGLANKIRAYALQDQGLDTVEANLALGFQDDERTYDVAAEILKALDVVSVRVMTNNPKKMNGLQDCGIQVDGRIPVLTEQTAHNKEYLACKKEKSGHLL